MAKDMKGDASDSQPWLAWTKHIPYRAMPNDGKFIRLTRLDPGLEDDDIHLHIEPILFDEAPPYEALSYAWLTHWKLPLIEVNVNDIQCWVPSNIVQFLLHRRPINAPAILWIDALCINQLDEDEKVRQIQLMPRIYGNCTIFTVWLGTDNPDMRFAFEKLKEIRDAEVNGDVIDIEGDRTARMRRPGYDSTLTQFGKIAQIFKRPWWRRLWIVQEVAYGNTSPNLRMSRLMCGSENISWSELVQAISNLSQDPSRGLVSSLEASRQALSRIQSSQDSSWTVDDDRKLINLYESNITRICSDERDRFLAMIGMVGPNKTHSMVVAEIRSLSHADDAYRYILERIELDDRRIEAARILAQVTQENSLDCLREFPKNPRNGLSFWAPTHHALEPLTDMFSLKITKDVKPQVRFSSDAKKMIVKGVALRIAPTHGQLDFAKMFNVVIGSPNEASERILKLELKSLLLDEDEHSDLEFSKEFSDRVLEWLTDLLSTSREEPGADSECLVAVMKWYQNDPKGSQWYQEFERRVAFRHIVPGVCTTLQRILSRRRIYITEEGWTILGPDCDGVGLSLKSSRKEEDFVMYLALLAGCDVLLLLTAEKEEPGKMAILGEAYVPHEYLKNSSRIPIPRNCEGEIVWGDISITARSHIDFSIQETAYKKKQA